MNMTNRSLTKLSLAGIVIPAVLLLILWHLSTPSGSGPLGILTVFVLLYVIFTAFMLLVTGLMSIGMVRLLNRSGIDTRRRYYVSSVLGFLPVLYLTLLSMGGANIWGILLIGLFVGLMLFYVLRRSA